MRINVLNVIFIWFIPFVDTFYIYKWKLSVYKLSYKIKCDILPPLRSLLSTQSFVYIQQKQKQRNSIIICSFLNIVLFCFVFCWPFKKSRKRNQQSQNIKCVKLSPITLWTALNYIKGYQFAEHFCSNFIAWKIMSIFFSLSQFV